MVTQEAREEKSHQYRAIIKRIKNGEIDLFTYLVRDFTRVVYTFIANKLYNRDEVEDLVQQTFLSFYKNIDRFDEKREVLPYLLQIATNEVRMFWRSHRQEVPLDEAVVIQDGHDPWSKFLDFDSLMAGLTHHQKEALRMLTEGYSYKEIARTLRRPLNTIRTIIRRARLSVLEQFGYGKTQKS